MIKPWLFLFIASVFETGWTYALKYMNFANLKNTWVSNGIMSTKMGTELIPIVSYVICGGGNIYFLSSAMKDIPTATAIAVWTAFSLVMIKILEVFYFKSSISYIESFFFALIIIGIIGLKKYAQN